MNVPNIGKVPGSAAAQSRTDAGKDHGPAPRADTVAPAGRHRHATAASGISLTQLACFDVNGDGTLDPRSAAAGGDATLLVPTHGADLPTYSRAANRPVAKRPSPPAPGTTRRTGTKPGAPNAAQANRAVDAYHRYGRTPPTPSLAVPGATPSSGLPGAAAVSPPARAGGLSATAAGDLTATRAS